jgi:hypothetical protein
MLTAEPMLRLSPRLLALRYCQSGTRIGTFGLARYTTRAGDRAGAGRHDHGDPPARINGLAIASLACGLGQFALGPLATVPAIVIGHMARGQIGRTGEQGAGLVLAGQVRGWGAVILGIVLFAPMR